MKPGLVLAKMEKPSSLQIASSDEDGHKRTGNVGTCAAHIITAVIGSGVLSLAWSTSQLGWIAGPLVLLSFAFVTYASASLMSDCYRSPHPVTGSRNPSYISAVGTILGGKHTWVCGLLQYFSFYGTAVAYVITTSISIRAIKKSNCFHKQGHEASCFYSDNLFMLLFGCVQIIVSQIPDFHNMEWLSVLASIMSFAYSSIGLALGFAKVVENQEIKGSIRGVAASSSFNKMSLAFQALGDIAFAYPYAIIVLEIQDTLKSPPPENQTMKKASLVSVLITTFFYLFCGCFGYAAFGEDTPGNILTGFGFYEPYWLVDLANACVVVHLVGGYQIFSQPVFALVEGWLAKRFPNNTFVHKFNSMKLPLLPRIRVNPLRICFRTAYVASTTGVAMLFPYFNQVIGLLGAFSFWPLSIYFPVEMYIIQKQVDVWTTKGIFLRIFSGLCLLVTVIALFGSVEGIVSEKLG